MAYCERCDLDDIMCPHGEAAQRRKVEAEQAARIAARNARWRRSSTQMPVRTSNREPGEGGDLGFTDFLRMPQHAHLAKSDLSNALSIRGCACDDCETGVGIDHHLTHPATPGLVRFSKIALWTSLFRLDEANHPDWMVDMDEWLAQVTHMYRDARGDREDEADLEAALRERSKSGRLPARWMGRSPGYYSR